MNDYMDIKGYKQYLTKKFRGLVSRKISENVARILTIFLFSISLKRTYFININLFLVFHFILNVVYSIKLKHAIAVHLFKESDLKYFEYIYAYGDSFAYKEMLSIANEKYYKLFRD